MDQERQEDDDSVRVYEYNGKKEIWEVEAAKQEGWIPYNHIPKTFKRMVEDGGLSSHIPSIPVALEGKGHLIEIRKDGIRRLKEDLYDRVDMEIAAMGGENLYVGKYFDRFGAPLEKVYQPEEYFEEEKDAEDAFNFLDQLARVDIVKK